MIIQLPFSFFQFPRSNEVDHRVKRWRQSGNETTFFVNYKTGELVQLLAEVQNGSIQVRYIMYRSAPGSHLYF